jgi:hypothetical protein
VKETGDEEMGEWMCDAVVDMFKDSSPSKSFTIHSYVIRCYLPLPHCYSSTENPVYAEEVDDFLVEE